MDKASDLPWDDDDEPAERPVVANGRRGGLVAASRMTPEQRRARASKAARASHAGLAPKCTQEARLPEATSLDTQAAIAHIRGLITGKQGGAFWLKTFENLAKWLTGKAE